MSKSLASVSEERRATVAIRRLVGGTHGLGFWAARDFFDRKGMSYPANSGIGRAQALQEAVDQYHEGDNFSTELLQTRAHKSDNSGYNSGSGEPKGRDHKPGINDRRPKQRLDMRSLPERKTSDGPFHAVGSSRKPYQQGTPGPRRSGEGSTGHRPFQQRGPRSTDNNHPSTTGRRYSYQPKDGQNRIRGTFPSLGSKPGYAYRSRVPKD